MSSEEIMSGFMNSSILAQAAGGKVMPSNWQQQPFQMTPFIFFAISFIRLPKLAHEMTSKRRCASPGKVDHACARVVPSRVTCWESQLQSKESA